MAPTEPTAPDAIPAYITDGIDRQDTETLAAIEEYARARREYLEASKSEISGRRQAGRRRLELVDVEDSKVGRSSSRRCPVERTVMAHQRVRR